MSKHGENWSGILEEAGDFDGAQRPEGYYMPMDDIVFTLNQIEDPRHQTLGYVLDEITEGEGWSKYPAEGTVPKKDLDDFISETVGHSAASEVILDELTTPYFETRWQPPYLEEENGEIGLPSTSRKDRIGDEITITSQPVESEIINYLEEKKYDQGHIRKSQIKEDLIPTIGKGFIENSPFSFRNSRVRNTNTRKLDGRSRAEYTLDLGLVSLTGKRGSDMVDRRNGSEDLYRSQLNPVQRGIYSKMNPDNGDLDVVMTDRHTARILPREEI